MLQGVEIREMKESEYPLLADFLYLSIFQKEGEPPLRRDIIEEPEIARYIEDFGKPHDYALVAVHQEQVVGVVFARLIHAYGYVDEATPELTISVLKDYRKKGIGSALLEGMVKLLREHDCEKISLSVQKENPAFQLYQNLGFTIVEDKGEDVVMLFLL